MKDERYTTLREEFEAVEDAMPDVGINDALNMLYAILKYMKMKSHNLYFDVKVNKIFNKE